MPSDSDDTTRQPGRRTFLIAAAGACLAAPCSSLLAGPGPLRLGTSTPGGGFHLYGETLARLINARNDSLQIIARPTSGTSENLELLKKGGLDAALIQGTAADELIRQGKLGDLVILHAMYPSPGLLAVSRNSTAGQLQDLKGQPVVWGVAASGLVTLARKVFDGIGLDIDRDFKAIYVPQAADAPGKVISGEAAGLWGAGEGWPGFLRLAESPAGARFLAPTQEQIAAIRKKHPLLRSMEVAADSYPGIDAPLATVGSVNLILARADLDGARAEAFVQGMAAIQRDLAAVMPQAAYSTRANSIEAAPTKALLHPVLR